MGIFSDIVSAIVHHAAHAAKPVDASASQPQAPHTEARAQAATDITNVDVAAVLDELAAEHHEGLDWRHSIVDLLKLLGLDSSLSARKRLAAELHYPGAASDSAEMNIWLHKEVMSELAENGGKVPEDLRH